MKRLLGWIVLALHCASATAAAAEWQVVLLKPQGCNTCTFVEEILKRASQMQSAVLADGTGGEVTARIQRRQTNELSSQEWQELRALPYFDEAVWRQRMAARSALVLLKRDGVVAAAGDIADSADLSGARLPPAITMPDTGDNILLAREARSKFLADTYLRTWNLSWFYRLALDPALAAPGGGIPAANATLAAPIGRSNVMLMSTATGAADNEIFNALRIEEIRDLLGQHVTPGPDSMHVFYGGGNAHGANALEVRDGRTELVRREVDGAEPFTPEAVQQIFASIRSKPASRNLLVLIGHGGPDGAGMWSSAAPLSAQTLRSLHEEAGGEDVLVSGNCFGGVMARATSCGFFGARPDIIATGCQADAAQVAQSRDYLHVFFSSLNPLLKAVADTNGDGKVSFAEAHWYASTDGDERNVTYTSIDALADAWFDAHPDQLPASLAAEQIRELAREAPAAEARAAQHLLAGVSPAYQVSLVDLAEQANQWQPRNRQPRPMLAQLARRLLYLQSPGHNTTDLARIQSCENRPIADFLAP